MTLHQHLRLDLKIIKQKTNYLVNQTIQQYLQFHKIIKKISKKKQMFVDHTK